MQRAGLLETLEGKVWGLCDLHRQRLIRHGEVGAGGPVIRRWDPGEDRAVLSAARGELAGVARALGRSYAACCRRRKYVRKMPASRPWTGAEIMWLQNRRGEGATFRVIAGELGRSVFSVGREWRRRAAPVS